MKSTDQLKVFGFRGALFNEDEDEACCNKSKRKYGCQRVNQETRRLSVGDKIDVKLDTLH